MSGWSRSDANGGLLRLRRHAGSSWASQHAPTSGQGVARSPGGAGRHGGRGALPATGAVSEDGR